jgi:hypothetical protein
MQATVNDKLVELGSLSSNEDKKVQRVGAKIVNEFFSSPTIKQDAETIANVLYYLTDIQVRDYAIGLVDTNKIDTLIPTLTYLLEQAPIDTEYVNAPASILAQVYYETNDMGNAFLTLSNATDNYPLAELLHRVFVAGWPTDSFASMRKELHPKVVAGIYGAEGETE